MKQKWNRVLDYLGLPLVGIAIVAAIAVGVAYLRQAPAGITDRDAANYLDYIANRYQTLIAGLVTGLLAIAAAVIAFLAVKSQIAQAEFKRLYEERRALQVQGQAMIGALVRLIDHVSPRIGWMLPSDEFLVATNTLSTSAVGLGSSMNFVISRLIGDVTAATERMMAVPMKTTSSRYAVPDRSHMPESLKEDLRHVEARLFSIMMIVDRLSGRLGDLEDSFELPYVDREPIIDALMENSLPTDRLGYVEGLFRQQEAQERPRT